MTTETLQAESVSAHPAETIRNLATEIQCLCSQMRHLADAIADNVSSEGRDPCTYDFATLIMKIADEASDEGEEIEKLATGLRLA